MPFLYRAVEFSDQSSLLSRYLYSETSKSVRKDGSYSVKPKTWGEHVFAYRLIGKHLHFIQVNILCFQNPTHLDIRLWWCQQLSLRHLSIEKDSVQLPGLLHKLAMTLFSFKTRGLYLRLTHILKAAEKLKVSKLKQFEMIYSSAVLLFYS